MICSEFKITFLKVVDFRVVSDRELKRYIFIRSKIREKEIKEIKDICVHLSDFLEPCMLRQRCPGRRSWGRTCRGHRIGVAEVLPDTLTPADVLERADPRACLAPDYLIREIAQRKFGVHFFVHTCARRGRKGAKRL